MKAYSSKDYSFEDAAHLLRRAGFGGTPAEIKEIRKLGPKLAVEKLLAFSKDDGTNPNPNNFRAIFEGPNGTQNNAPRQAINVLQGWWLHKMLTTTQPLKEKLTLFWHGHFATELDKVRNPFMLEEQNELFRNRGLGRFDDLVLEVSRDPAMLVYLDNAQNIKGRPNENYARELMELFTMGVHGGYTERDVQESARAFTGWGLENLKGRIRFDGKPKFKFFPGKHDDGQKTFLTERGNFDGADIVRMTAQHPSTARFITGKLWKFFVSEDLPKATADELAKLWQDTEANVREVMREILTSEKFYAPENRLSLIKSPIEYVIGALRSSGARPTSAQMIALVNQLDTMAQVPFHPPNVKGWDGGLDWIADGTVLARLNFMGALQGGKLPGRDLFAEKPQVPPAPIPNLTWPFGANVSETIDLIGRHFLGAAPTGTLRKSLESFAKGRNTPDVARRLAYLVLISPQFQVA